MSRVWSKYQLAIFDANKSDPGNKFVVATAGSGKTTVIEQCINDVPMDLTVLAVAFGRDIKAELEKRLGSLPNVTVKTLNGFGHAANWARIRRRINIDTDKVVNILYYDVMGKPTEKAEKDLYYGNRYLICKIIGLLKANMIWEPTDADIQELMEIHGIVLPKNSKPEVIFTLLKDTYKRNWTKTLVMDYDDQIAMSLFHDWPCATYDRVYVDEAQDLTPAQIELVSRAAQTGTRYYFVGDPRQAIYLFRGADSRAVQNIIERMDCGKLPLSVSYRCSKAVVRRAQQKAPEIEFHADAAEGSDTELSTNDFRNQARDGDFVLCRTTAPLVSECLRAIRNGRKASVRGREIGDGLISFIDGVGYGYDDTAGFLDALTAWVCTKEAALAGAGRANALILLSDQTETIRVLAEESATVSGIKARIKSIFEDNQSSGIMFMTIHKSKGLESPRVWILRPDLMPHKMATTEEQLVAEDNLWFVAVTRCKLDLFWVKPEKDNGVPA